MRLFFIFFSIFIIFTQCSSNDNKQASEVTQIQDEFFDDFEDEMDIKDDYDPFEPYNRFMTKFNDSLYVDFLTPVANIYNKITHVEIRKSIKRFFKNLMYPTRVVNNLLQGKFKNSGEETLRFLLNSTFGILGLLDPAKDGFDLNEHNEDFGQTLGFYGVGGGPHIVLPLWGPSNLRDTISIFPDSYLSPVDYAPRAWFTLTDNWWSFLGVKAYEQVNKFSLNMETYEKLKKDSIDLYPFLKDVYNQHREKEIRE